MVIRFQLQRVGDCGVCGNAEVPLYFQSVPALRADRGKVWCIWCWKQRYGGSAVHISSAEGAPHATQVAFSIHDDDWAQVRVTVLPQMLHYPAASGIPPKPLWQMTREQIVEWERLWNDALAGKRELLVRTKLSPTPKPIAREVIPDADSADVDSDDESSGPVDESAELRERKAHDYRALATTALSLILRMARGYDWRPAEVDAFEAACRDAGIEIGATEPSAKKSADTDRER